MEQHEIDTLKAERTMLQSIEGSNADQAHAQEILNGGPAPKADPKRAARIAEINRLLRPIEHPAQVPGYRGNRTRRGYRG